MTKDKCIEFFQIQIWNAFLSKRKLSNIETTKLFDKNNIWNFIKDGYDVLESETNDEIIKIINKVIKNGGYNAI